MLVGQYARLAQTDPGVNIIRMGGQFQTEQPTIKTGQFPANPAKGKWPLFKRPNVSGQEPNTDNSQTSSYWR